MATGRIQRMVLHDLASYAVIYMECDDISRLAELPDSIEGPGCHITAVELGISTDYYVIETLEKVADYVADNAPATFARLVAAGIGL